MLFYISNKSLFVQYWLLLFFTYMQMYLISQELNDQFLSKVIPQNLNVSAFVPWANMQKKSPIQLTLIIIIF